MTRILRTANANIRTTSGVNTDVVPVQAAASSTRSGNDDTQCDVVHEDEKQRGRCRTCKQPMAMNESEPSHGPLLQQIQAVGGRSRTSTSTGVATTITTDTVPAQHTEAPSSPAVNVETQCGVELEDGRQCARSLTCKRHGMGKKRAVPGRSAPYDLLLQQIRAYQQQQQQ